MKFGLSIRPGVGAPPGPGMSVCFLEYRARVRLARVREGGTTIGYCHLTGRPLKERLTPRPGRSGPAFSGVAPCDPPGGSAGCGRPRSLDLPPDSDRASAGRSMPDGWVPEGSRGGDAGRARCPLARTRDAAAQTLCSPKRRRGRKRRAPDADADAPRPRRGRRASGRAVAQKVSDEDSAGDDAPPVPAPARPARRKRAHLSRTVTLDDELLLEDALRRSVGARRPSRSSSFDDAPNVSPDASPVWGSPGKESDASAASLASGPGSLVGDDDDALCRNPYALLPDLDDRRGGVAPPWLDLDGSDDGSGGPCGGDGDLDDDSRFDFDESRSDLEDGGGSCCSEDWNFAKTDLAGFRAFPERPPPPRDGGRGAAGDRGGDDDRASTAADGDDDLLAGLADLVELEPREPDAPLPPPPAPTPVG